MQTTTEEIAAYLAHKDYSLALRRMLDYSLDIGDDKLIYETMECSKLYRLQEKQNSENKISDVFSTKAQQLLEKLNKANKNTFSIVSPLFEATQISKQYKKSTFSLKPLNISLSTGNILGIVGENGNGKTTLLRSLSGQLALDQGNIEYKLLSKPDYYSIKNHTVFIPQRIPKWYGLLKDNLHFSASLVGVTGNKNNIMVSFMLERLGLSDYAHLNWSQISSGYRTRFEIARVLLQKPRLLILDEPLANLDINAQQTILTDLKFIAKSLHNPMGIILSSQQLHEVEKVADTVLFIKQGVSVFKANNNLDSVTSFVVEVETTANRNLLVQILGDSTIQVQYNGGFYTITSTHKTAQQIITQLINNNVSISYFRDITYSTKRFF